MPNVHADPSLQSAREQIAYARAELVLGAKRLRELAEPPLGEVRMMCEAIIEHMTAVEMYEAACEAARDGRDPGEVYAEAVLAELERGPRP